jgi:hypothetical protein
VIWTIEQLIALTEREVALDPSFGDEILLRTPGCTPDELDKLGEALPGLPESYLSVAARVALPNVSIGYLNLAPGRRQDGSLLKRLTHANSSAWPLWEFVDQQNLYHVADYEGDMICVVREGSPNVGEVLRVDLSCPPTPNLHRTAQSFEQLLLGFGNLHEQHIAERFGPEVIDEVLTSMQAELGLDEEQMEDWTWVAEVALGEDESYDQHVDVAPPALGSHIQQTSNVQLDYSDYDADIVSEHMRPAPEGYDAYTAIPSWPGWQVDVFVDRLHGGIPVRGFWTIFEERIYKLVQQSEFVPLSGSGYAERYRPQICLLVVKGRPKPGYRDWTLLDVASYDLPGVEIGVEATEEIAALRRGLPELLAELPKKKTKASGRTARDDALD